MRQIGSKLFAVPVALALLAVAACAGNDSVVTLTATPSTDNFLVYRVGLTGILLQTSSGKAGPQVLSAETTVDFAQLSNLSEVLGIPTAAKGTYTSAVVTLDYSQAQIVYDDGSLDGLALLPVGSNGKTLGQIQVTVNLDPADPLRIVAKQTGRLSLDFKMAATNLVDVSAQTVTITPLMIASTVQIDNKQVHLRGPIEAVESSGTYLSGVAPFDSSANGTGQLPIATSDTTTFEVNGNGSTGSVGVTALAAIGQSQGSLAEAYGTLTSSATIPTPDDPAAPASAALPGAALGSTVTTDASTTTSSVVFTATQVLAGTSVAGTSSDLVTGVVTARSGNTLALEDATVQNGGTATFIQGETVVNVGPNTLVTVFGQGVPGFINAQQISVGSVITAFGVAQTAGNNGVILDASAGFVRLNATTASGIVAAQGAGSLNLALTSLGNRAVSAFDFSGTNANAGQYSASTGSLDLSNAVAGAPVIVSGLPAAFGVSSPNITAVTLLDPTTIQAELVVDWGAGTTAPFVTFDSTSIDVDAKNTSIGFRHQIQVGSQVINVVGLAQDPTLSPSTSSPTIFAIGHFSQASTETFDSYAAFIAKLQTELNGVNLATGITAVGQYTASTSVFSATSITLFLNN
jgi:hypothetical protein